MNNMLYILIIDFVPLSKIGGSIFIRRRKVLNNRGEYFLANLDRDDMNEDFFRGELNFSATSYDHPRRIKTTSAASQRLS